MDGVNLIQNNALLQFINIESFVTVFCIFIIFGLCGLRGVQQSGSRVRWQCLMEILMNMGDTASLNGVDPFHFMHSHNEWLNIGN